MSLVSSMFSAANGLTAHSEALGTVSDNIANVNTVGFKENRANFADMVASSPASVGRAMNSGQGSYISKIEEQFNQGALLSTGGALDLALQGDGFFMVNGAYNAIAGNYFTRAGQFHVAQNGDMINDEGMVVQGYMADNNGNMSPILGNIRLENTVQAPPHPTANLTVGLNLSSTDTVGPAFDATNPATTSDYANSTTVWDSRGGAHALDVYFRNTGGNNWEWHALAQGAEVAGGTAGTGVEVGTGTLSFTTDGALQSVVGKTATVSFNDATPGQIMTFDFGDPIADAGTGLRGVTSYSGEATLDKITQDGYPEGQLSAVGISSDGRIQGSFNNGHTRVLGQLAIARFSNNQGLERVGGTMWGATLDSGEAAVGAPAIGGQAGVVTGSLEQSNVNLAQEFINLLTYQRGFQANTRTVSASDEMLQGLVNLGR